MPVPTVEQLEQKEATLKKRIADQCDSAERAARRALGKKLRRVQRRRRKLVVEATRKAAKPAASAPAEAAPAPAETPAAEAPAADSPEAETKSE